MSINCGFSMVINRKILTINMQHKNIFTVPIKNQWFSSFLCSLLIYTEKSAAALLLMALHRTRLNNPRNVIFLWFPALHLPAARSFESLNHHDFRLHKRASCSRQTQSIFCLLRSSAALSLCEDFRILFKSFFKIFFQRMHSWSSFYLKTENGIFYFSIAL